MVKATKITILWSEATRVENIEFIGENVFQQANDYLKWLAHGLPGKHLGYYKTKFRIDYQDGETYEGRYDLKRHDIFYGDLGRHVRGICEFCSGRKKPDHLTEEQYRNCLASYPSGMSEQCSQFLDTYEIA